MIEVRNISKSFGDVKVLDDISVTFEKGMTNLVIGKSGSGKTVLLKSIVGLHEVDEGIILYDDRIFNKMNFKEKKEIRKEIGMLFQGGALFDSLTVEENVRYPLDMFTEQSYGEKRERVDFCLKRVNMENSNKLYPVRVKWGYEKKSRNCQSYCTKSKVSFL